MNSRICDSVQDIRFRGAGMASPFTIVPMRTIVLAVLNLCISAAAFAQPGTCAGLSPGPLASLNGFVPFPSSNLWNTDISKAPVDPNSANLIDYIGASVTLHPDFGAGLYAGQTMGIPYQIEAGTQAKVPVKLTEYPGNSDPGPMPIPANALIEGYPKPGNGDRHGLVRYDEVAAGAINHAVRFTVPLTQQAFTPPASHWAPTTTDANAPPMGMRMRLKASFDISGFSSANQVILTALKKYGMILADNGSAIFITGMPDSHWNNNDLDMLKSITASSFDVVLMNPVYTPSNVPTGFIRT